MKISKYERRFKELTVFRENAMVGVGERYDAQIITPDFKGCDEEEQSEYRRKAHMVRVLAKWRVKCAMEGFERLLEQAEWWFDETTNLSVKFLAHAVGEEQQPDLLKVLTSMRTYQLDETWNIIFVLRHGLIEAEDMTMNARARLRKLIKRRPPASPRAAEDMLSQGTQA